MALGQTLRNSREQQGFTLKQVAEATHIMVQIIEELEAEDFSRIAAPIYGRGFIKLYADFLSIDPAPLVAEFNTIYSGEQRPNVKTRDVKKPHPDAATKPAREPASPPSPPRQMPLTSASAPAAGETPMRATSAPEQLEPSKDVPHVPENRDEDPVEDARPSLKLESETVSTAEALDELYGVVERPGRQRHRLETGAGGWLGKLSARSRSAMGRVRRDLKWWYRGLRDDASLGFAGMTVRVTTLIPIVALVLVLSIVAAVLLGRGRGAGAGTESALAPVGVTDLLPPPEPYFD